MPEEKIEGEEPSEVVEEVEEESEVEEATEEEPKEEVEEVVDEDEEPKKRFPAQDNKLGYKLRKLEEENRKLKESSSYDEDDEEDEKPVTKRELKELFEKTNKETASNQMVNEFLSENPDYKKHERLIRKYVNDPDYSNVPIGFIASGIIGEHIDDEANQRAKLKIDADKEASRTKSGGSSKRSIPGKTKGVWDMSKEEFEQYQNEVSQG